MNGLIKSFIDDLKNMGYNPVFDIDKEIIFLEYPIKDHTKEVMKLFDRYIGFWKSIAIRVNHDKTNKIARFEIPFNLITGKDLTNDQLMGAVEYIQNNV